MKLECMLAVMAALGAVAMAAKMCKTCEREKCEPLNAAVCIVGVARDDCDCCDICAKQEDETCDKEKKRDQCGDGLLCEYNDPDNHDAGATCQCRFKEVLCGNDNKTYSNLCKLMVAAVLERRTNTLNVMKVGPCEPGATIVTKPKYVHNETGTNVVLQCEAMGSPSPSMAWVFRRADNQTFNLPGDDFKMVTSVRGGPGKFMATSWLQIGGLMKFHEGDYSCVAFNQFRTDKADARIKVEAKP